MTISTATFAWVADLVRSQSSISLRPGKEYLVESRIAPLAKKAGAASVDAWVDSLRTRGSRTDLFAIVEALTTNETSWFRDNSPFTALRQVVLPELLANRSAGAPIKIWSAACSTGQEPYSLAMTLLDVLPPSVQFEILATDLSTQVLDQAKAGRYSQLEINRGMPAQYMVRFLKRVGPMWEVTDDVRRKVSFRQHNLTEAAPAGPFDLVFCRNVLIYFEPQTKRMVFDRIRKVLKPDGVLVLGAAESTMGIDDSRWSRISEVQGAFYRAVPDSTMSPSSSQRSSSSFARI